MTQPETPPDSGAPRTQRLQRFIENMRAGLLIEEAVGLEDDQFVDDIEALLAEARAASEVPPEHSIGDDCTEDDIGHFAWLERAGASEVPPPRPAMHDPRTHILRYRDGCPSEVPPLPLDVERLARALVECCPGYFAWPDDGDPNTGVPYKNNALWVAGGLNEAYARLTPPEPPVSQMWPNGVIAEEYEGD